jgi:hypothetical protein
MAAPTFDFQSKIDNALSKGATPNELMTMLSGRPDLQALIPGVTAPVDNLPAVEPQGQGLLGNISSKAQELGGALDERGLNPMNVPGIGILLGSGFDAVQSGVEAFQGSDSLLSGLGAGGVAAAGSIADDIGGVVDTAQQGTSELIAGATGLEAQESALLEDPTAAPEFLADQAAQMAKANIPTPTVDALPQDATVPEVKTALNEDKAANGRQTMLDSGASPKALSAWDSFTDNIDLMTFGLSMMNLSGGEGSLTQNLARSMQAGIDSKTATADLGIARGRLDRAESRSDRKLDIDKQKADAQSRAANAAFQRAVNAGASAGGAIDNKALLDVTAQWLENQGVGSKEAMGVSSQFISDVAAYVRATGKSEAEGHAAMLDIYQENEVEGFISNPLGFLPFVGDFK